MFVHNALPLGSQVQRFKLCLGPLILTSPNHRYVKGAFGIECSELLKRIANVRERRVARRRRAIELLVLVIIALLLGVPLLWFAWLRATE